MRESLAGRLLLSGLTLLLVSAALYAAIRSLPGSPAWGDDTGARPTVESWLIRQHVADPLPLGYARWLADLIRLDLGISLSVQPGRPVAELLGAALPWTALLGSLAILLVLGMALPLGGLAATWPGAPASRALTFLLYALHAMPVFVVALLLQQVVAGRWRLLPGLGPQPAEAGDPAGLLTTLSHWVLPVASLALGSLAFVVRFVRGTLLEGMEQRWAGAAGARGASRGWVVSNHALRHAALSLVSLIGLILPSALGGSVLVESVFALPGVGRLFFTAVARRDYPVILAVSMMVCLATIVAGILSEALYRLVDPRVRARKDEAPA